MGHFTVTTLSYVQFCSPQVPLCLRHLACACFHILLPSPVLQPSFLLPFSHAASSPTFVLPPYPLLQAFPRLPSLTSFPPPSPLGCARRSAVHTSSPERWFFGFSRLPRWRHWTVYFCGRSLLRAAARLVRVWFYSPAVLRCFLLQTACMPQVCCTVCVVDENSAGGRRYTFPTPTGPRHYGPTTGGRYHRLRTLPRLPGYVN